MILTTVWRYLKRINFSYKKVKDTFIFKDPLYDLKKAHLALLKRFLPDSFRLVFVDEKGFVHALRHNSRCWSEKTICRDVKQVSEGKVKFLGAYDPKRDLMYMEPMMNGGSKAFCETLTTLTVRLQDYPWRKFIIVIDNASICHSIFTVDYWNKDPRIEFFFLPTYSTELNTIEKYFGHDNHECLNNNSFDNPSKLIDATFDWCYYYNGLREETYAKEGIIII